MRWNLGLLGVCVTLGLAVMGCGNAHEGENDGDAGPIPNEDAAPIAVTCGSAVCPIGYVCCNASCGICTLPSEGCVDIECADAGPAPDAGPIIRRCGGLISGTCNANEYCDFPDNSSCGGDDQEGICTPRPIDCPDPGGNLVCGCDDHTYVGDCSAYFNGTDIAHQGSCGMPTPAVHSLSATSTCAPWDGPAWTFLFTGGPAAMCSPATGPQLSFSLFSDLASVSEQTFPIGNGSTSQGMATSCPAGVGGPPCLVLSGTVTVHSFVDSETAVVSWHLQASDGSLVEGDHVSVNGWCPTQRFCG